MDEPERGFAPWCDSAFLDEESEYSLWNKIAWFGNVSPPSLVKACRTQERKGVSGSNKINYGDIKWKFWDQEAALPLIGGQRAKFVLDRLALLASDEVPSEWRSAHLRVCPACIKLGVHLRIHQHKAVALCPLHLRPLRDTCFGCSVKLSYASNHRPAFCCLQCGACFLRGAGLCIEFTSTFRIDLAQSVKEAHDWLRPLGAGVGSRHALTGALSGRSAIVLAGMLASSAAPPSWLAKPTEYFGNVSIASVDLTASKLGQAFRRGKDIQTWAVQDAHFGALKTEAGPENKDEHRWSFLHYRQALVRVASVFLARAGKFHAQCIDAPVLIAGEDEHVDWQAILGCCPVALGFWLWRQRASLFCLWSAKRASDESVLQRIGAGRLGGNIDLVLYALERSDLHACVLAAKNVRSHLYKAPSRDVEIALQALRQRAYYDLFPENATSLAWQGASPITFVRADATCLLDSKRCSGLAPYHALLKRQCGASPADWVSSDSAPRRRLRPQRTATTSSMDFLPMRRDWLFTTTDDEANFGWSRAMAIFRSPAFRSMDGRYSCIDAAVTSRSATPDLPSRA